MTLAESSTVTSLPLNAIPQFMIKACWGEAEFKTEIFTFLYMTWIQLNDEDRALWDNVNEG